MGKYGKTLLKNHTIRKCEKVKIDIFNIPNLSTLHDGEIFHFSRFLPWEKVVGSILWNDLSLDCTLWTELPDVSPYNNVQRSVSKRLRR